MALLPRRSLLLAVGAAAALAVAGCGDDEETTTAAQGTGGDTTAEDTATSGGGEASVDVSAVDFAFEPSDPAISEDGEVSVNLTNDGEFPHALEIEELEESTATIDPGQSDTLTTELDSGEYTIYCPVGDHREQGMEGTLTVGGGGGSGSGAATDDDSGADNTGSDDDSGSDDSASGGSGGGY